MRFEELARELRRKGATAEAALAELRAAGASPAECVAVLHEWYEMPLLEAKRALLASEAWTDLRQFWEGVVEEVMQEVKERADKP